MFFTVTIKCVCICKFQKKSGLYVRKVLIFFLSLRSKNSYSSIFPHQGLCSVIWHADLPYSGLPYSIVINVASYYWYHPKILFSYFNFSLSASSSSWFPFHFISYDVPAVSPISFCQSNLPSFWPQYDHPAPNIYYVNWYHYLAEWLTISNWESRAFLAVGQRS